MRYRPHDLSTMLCYLVDSRKVTIEDIARESGCSSEYIEKLTRKDGIAIDWATRHDVGKAISHFHRLHPETRPPSEYAMEQRRLKLVDDLEGEWKGTPRCVIEDPYAPPGVRVFKSIDSKGQCREERRFMASDVSRQVERRILLGMELLLDILDPVAESMNT